MTEKRASLILDILDGTLSMFKGLWVTLKCWREPRVTVQYPFKEKLAYAPRYRGRMVHLRDRKTGQPKCTACQACVKACPANVVSVEAGDGRGKDRRAKCYVWNEARCMFCNLCVEACPFDAIVLTNQTDGPVYDKEELVWHLERLLEPWCAEKNLDPKVERELPEDE